MGKSSIKNKNITVAFSILLIIGLCIGIGVGLECGAIESTDALTTTAGADVISGDLMNNNKLDLNVAKNLVNKLFNTVVYNDIKQYIETNGGTEYALTGSYVVPSSTISSNPNGLVVQLDGKDWMVASLTLADVGAETGQIIATLYLADDIDANEYSFYSNAADSKGNNMYSASIIRDQLLTHSSFSNLVGGNFATKYLVQPKYISYQKQQTLYGRASGYYDSPNDALENPAKGQWCYTNTMYNPGDTVTRSGVTYTYEDWGNDYIWLPSLAEVGISINGSAPSMWGLTNSQREHSLASYCWLRTGGHSHFGYAYRFDKTGALNPTPIAVNAGIRPALHLNLTSSTYASSVPVPTDFTTEYSGDSRNIKAMADAETAQTSNWSVAGLWNNLDKSVGKDGVTYTALNGATLNTDGLPKDVGDYEIEFTLSNTVWATGTIALSRKITLTIEKKKIGVNLTLDSNNVPQAAAIIGDVHLNDTEQNGRAPKFVFEYKNTVSGLTYNTYPTGIIGSYIATAKIDNNCNYQLDGTYTIPFTINKTKVKKPGVAIAAKPYTGTNVDFTLAQYSSSVNVNVVTPSGKTPAVVSGNKITVTDVAKYRVTISLADNGTSTCWDTSVNNDIAPFSFDIEVQPKELIPTIACSDTDFSWEVGASPQMTITDDRLSGDNIEYYVYYLKGSDPTKYDGIDSNKQVVGNSVVITIPNDLVIGNYSFVVELSSSAGNDNSNYFINGTSKIRQFSVIGKGISVTPSSINWQVNNRPITEVGTFANDKLTLTYSGSEFVFGIDDSNLKALGVKIDVSQGTNGFSGDIRQTNANAAYEVTVYICNYDASTTAYNSSFSLKYEIQKAKYNLDAVKWDYADGTLKYTGTKQSIILKGLPNNLTVAPNDYDENEKRDAGTYQASVLAFSNADSNNYITPLFGQPQTYDGSFDWTIQWTIGKAELILEWENRQLQGINFKVPQVKGTNEQYIDAMQYKYYDSNGTSVGNEISLNSIQVGSSAVRYWVEAHLRANVSQNYEISQATRMKSFRVGSNLEMITVELSAENFTYDGNPHGGELKITSGAIDLSRIKKEYYKDSVSNANKLENPPTDAGNYIVVLSLSEEDEDDGYALSNTQLNFNIGKVKIKAEWNTDGQTPKIANLSETLAAVVGYVYYDADGNELPDGATLEKGKAYKVKAVITGNNGVNYEFTADNDAALESVTATEKVDFTAKGNSNSGTVVDFDNAGKVLKDWWQVAASGVSIVLIIIFVGKTISYENRRKKAKKTVNEKYATFFAGATGLFGLQMTYWTVIASVLMGLAVITFVIMLIVKNRCSKAEEELSSSKDEYNKMMFMRMMSGNNGNQQSVQSAVGAEDMRMMINDAVSAMIPSMQQMLPQQASGNDDLVQQLMEKEEQNNETIKKLMEQLAQKQADNSANDELVQKLIAQNEKLMQQLAEKPAEKVVEKEVATANSNDELVKSLLEEQRAMREIMQKLAAQPQQVIMPQPQVVQAQPIVPAQPQIIERVVEKPVEKIVEKEVRVEVPVEKVVEKPVVHVISSEVEKSQQVKPTPKKETAPRLTLEEAYAKLTKEQKKYFDGLREYAMKKDSKCKEKLATYFTTIGPSTTNPLIKLTIKKGVTVALFKMEDEYLKDIRRNASSDGTKLKVKETELPVGDSQAFDTAKDMIDLRVDQIERYEDFMKEQRAMKRK